MTLSTVVIAHDKKIGVDYERHCDNYYNRNNDCWFYRKDCFN